MSKCKACGQDIIDEWSESFGHLCSGIDVRDSSLEDMAKFFGKQMAEQSLLIIEVESLKTEIIRLKMLLDKNGIYE